MEIKVTGLKELQRKLVEIGSVAGTKSMRGAMMAATRPIQDQAKNTAPVRSGALRQAVGRTFGVRSFGGALSFGDSAGSNFSVLIGPKVRNRTAVALYNLIYKPRRPRRGIFHGHFVEFGTKSGVRATNWLRNALQSQANQSVSKLAVELRTRIEKVARKR